MSVVTPVRRSLRNIQKRMTGSSSNRKRKNQYLITNIKEDPDTPIPTKYHTSKSEEEKEDPELFNGQMNIIKKNLEKNKGKIKEEHEELKDVDRTFLSSDFEDIFKPSNKFEAIEDILEKHDYAFIPNKVIKISLKYYSYNIYIINN